MSRCEGIVAALLPPRRGMDDRVWKYVQCGIRRSRDSHHHKLMEAMQMKPLVQRRDLP